MEISLFQMHKNKISRKMNIDRMKTFDPIAQAHVYRNISHSSSEKFIRIEN